MLAEIIRLEESGEATLGVLRVDGRLFCLTLELPDRGNAPDVSRIPEGRYRCAPVDSPRFGRAIAVRDVPGRDHILFHPGNTAADTRGCILPGTRPGRMDGRRAVLESASAMRALLEAAGGRDFELLVTRPAVSDGTPGPDEGENVVASRPIPLRDGAMRAERGL